MADFKKLLSNFTEEYFGESVGDTKNVVVRCKFNEVLDQLFFEADGDEEPAPEEAPVDPALDGGETPPEGNVEGVEGVDVLAAPESALDDSKAEAMIKPLVDMANILLNSLKFKPSDEFHAYINMPMFKELTDFEKLTKIRNILVDHPEKIIQEAGEIPEEEDAPQDFGELDESGLDEVTERDLLRLIIKAMNVDPYSLDAEYSELPTIATEDNYEEIITKIESMLF